MKIEPLFNKPCCLYEDSLILGDLHLGIERSYEEEGIRIPTQTAKWREKILEICKNKEINELIFLGDVKNQIPNLSWQERKEIPLFLEKIAQEYKITIIPGNHDGNIDKLLPDNPKKDIKIEDSAGMRKGELFLFHGHTWPKKEAFSKLEIVMAHNHPIIRFKDELGRCHDEKTWIRAKLDEEKIKKQYKDKIDWNNPELIIGPAFNPLVGGVPFNSSPDNFLGPLLNSDIFKYESMEANLVDGTYLGRVEELEDIELNEKK